MDAPPCMASDELPPSTNGSVDVVSRFITGTLQAHALPGDASFSETGNWGLGQMATHLLPTAKSCCRNTCAYRSGGQDHQGDREHATLVDPGLGPSGHSE